MANRNYKLTTIKKLFTLSGNICAYPDCSESIIDKSGNVIGIICHIEAASVGGPRYRASQSEEERRDFDNLMLMCHPHHKKIDNETEFSVTQLKEIKKNHENKFSKNPFQISDEKLSNVMEQLLSKLESIEESVKPIPEIKQETSQLIQKSDEIIDLLTKGKIENAFDLQQKSAKKIASDIFQISKKLKASSENYDYDMKISNDISSIEITHKQFDKMDKSGMTFETSLKLNNQKSQSLDELIKSSKDGKITINADEIEEISISKGGEVLYVARGLSQAQLTIEKDKPKPRLTKLVVPRKQESIDYLLLSATREGDILTFSNDEQKDHPFEIKIIVNVKTHESHVTIDPRTAIAGVLECYDYVKLMHSLSQIKELVLVDREKNKPILTLKSKENIMPVEHYWLEFYRKLAEIQKLTGVMLPWPPLEISREGQNDIFNLYDILTTGKATGTMTSNMKIEKGEIAGTKLIEELSRTGYCKSIFMPIQEKEFIIFGKVIKVGKFKMTGRLTTDILPHEFIDKYNKAKDGETITVKMITLEGNAKYEYVDWPKSKKNSRK